MSASNPNFLHGPRRAFLKTGVALAAASCTPIRRTDTGEFESAMLSLAEMFETRLGVMAIDTATGRTLGFADQRRFAMASTFKLPLVASVLQQVDNGILSLSQKLPVTESDMTFHAPVTERFVGKGSMSVNQLCAATIVYSDNPAANILLRKLGGPERLTAFARAHGDTMTRFDRYEPALNSNSAGDSRDTTTPRAMATLTAQILRGDLLRVESRERLIDWLVGSRTGLDRLRAGIPAHWRSGDKTGSARGGLINDVMVAWPPERQPIIIAAYLSDSPQASDALKAVHVAIARQVVDEWGFAT